MEIFNSIHPCFIFPFFRLFPIPIVISKSNGFPLRHAAGEKPIVTARFSHLISFSFIFFCFVSKISAGTWNEPSVIFSQTIEIRKGHSKFSCSIYLLIFSFWLFSRQKKKKTGALPLLPSLPSRQKSIIHHYKIRRGPSSSWEIEWIDNLFERNMNLNLSLLSRIP